MESNEQRGVKTEALDFDKRVEAARILREDAKAIESALIQELSERRDRLKKQVQALDSDLQDVEFKLSCLRGEVDEPIEDFYSRRHHVSDEVILALLAHQHTTGAVQEYFHFSSATVCRRLNALLAAKKITLEKRGTSKVWEAKH